MIRGSSWTLNFLVSFKLPMEISTVYSPPGSTEGSAKLLLSPALRGIALGCGLFLGFSKEDRDTNIRRVGYVAGLIAQHGGTTLCSVISPYRAIRDEARKMSRGNFVEVYCEHPNRRLRKARRQGDVRQGPRGGRRGQAHGLHRR